MFAAESGFERLPLEAEKEEHAADDLKAFTYFNVGFFFFYLFFLNLGEQPNTGFTVCVPEQ